MKEGTKKDFCKAMLRDEYTLEQFRKCRAEGRSPFLDWCKQNRIMVDFRDLNDREKNEMAGVMIQNGILD